MTDDERERLRQECHDDLAALRPESLPERAYRLIEKLVARLDRLETGVFSELEAPTSPERRPSLTRWKNEEVLKALEEGKKLTEKKDGE